jgi:hypothetical protein
MLDLITGSIYYDLGNTMLNDQIKDGIFTTLFNKKSSGEYVSTVTSKLSSIEAAIANVTGK